tara:strand:- start:214 stop:423 length:210 start_codon:yes stop_codon:yes gene_type:complete
MCGSAPSTPVAPPAAPEAAQAPSVAGVKKAGTNDKKRRANAGGAGTGTILTGPGGDTSGTSTTKTLLGQ